MKYLSALLTQASGSIGGATASKNRGGNYFRAKVAPVQPRTVSQQSVRSNLATLAAMWRTLTATEIAGWNSLASSITLSDALGNKYSPSGIDLFVGNNRNLSDVGETLVTTPPSTSADFEDLSPINATITAATQAFAIVPEIAEAPTGFVFLVRATRQLSPGISYVGKSDMRNVQTFPASAYASLNILAKYTAMFGALVAGQRVQVSVQLVQVSSGFKSLPFTALLTVGA